MGAASPALPTLLQLPSREIHLNPSSGSWYIVLLSSPGPLGTVAATGKIAHGINLSMPATYVHSRPFSLKKKKVFERAT